VILASWYVALKHELPTDLPRELEASRDRLLFARWLVLTGRLSDFGPYPSLISREPAPDEPRAEPREAARGQARGARRLARAVQGQATPAPMAAARAVRPRPPATG
jgi:hypothetical protein